MDALAAFRSLYPHLDNATLALVNNDAAACAGDSEAAILEYYETCEAEANCVMLPFGDAAPLMALVATRDVAAGDELLLSYGHSYWIEHFGGTPPPPTPAVTRAAARMWGDGLDAMVARLAASYASDVRLLEGVLAKWS